MGVRFVLKCSSSFWTYFQTWKGLPLAKKDRFHRFKIHGQQNTVMKECQPFKRCTFIYCSTLDSFQVLLQVSSVHLTSDFVSDLKKFPEQKIATVILFFRRNFGARKCAIK